MQLQTYKTQNALRVARETQCSFSVKLDKDTWLEWNIKFPIVYLAGVNLYRVIKWGNFVKRVHKKGLKNWGSAFVPVYAVM